MRLIGVDVGGTFTDVVALRRRTRRSCTVGKSPTSPADAHVAVRRARQARRLASTWQRSGVVHGITIGTNAILERKGAASWMLTTRAFATCSRSRAPTARCSTTSARCKPPPLVAAHAHLEVDERMTLRRRGAARRSTTAERAHRAVAPIAAPSGAARRRRSASCTATPTPRTSGRRRGDRRRCVPGWFVCTSAEVLPRVPRVRALQHDGAERLHRPAGGRLSRRARPRRSRRAATRGSVFIMTSSGGVVTAERAARFPVAHGAVRARRRRRRRRAPRRADRRRRTSSPTTWAARAPTSA